MNYPEMCYVYVEVGCEIGVVKFGEKGYYQTEYESNQSNEQYVKKLNSQLGVTDNEAAAMKILSMNDGIDGNNKEWQRLFTQIVERLDKKTA